MQDIFKDPIPNPDDIFDNVIEEVFDQKFGRKKYIVKKILKQKPEDKESNNGKKAKTVQETMFLQKRTEDLKLDKNIGKRVTVTKESQKQEHGGFYCQLCDTHVWDSNAWLDHINGKKHLRLIGMNNKVMKVDVSCVQQKLQSLKNKDMIQIDELDEIQKEEELKKQKKKLKKNNEDKNDRNEQNNQEQQLNLQNKDKQYLQEDIKADQQKNTEQKSQEEEEEDEDEEQLLMKQMGLPTQFFSKKQK
ncbi:zinc matrin type 2, putative [Ichthyophthirius multifiliis]|uniref:Zinc matrin type 2, putative n=1 Tax=Ichthyophthirius multifiliis TaxID=5932 RepID=G0QZH4_ICHMU|nr:zinc matrin type 2, putative [Ichthyophthirius multifiliis]EGR29384.1 zinc matrin type 2, putative [Ichthyophthirius multifiliis]|eukprot:XP_004030620.1 zinc matrin type 2, putative [Ichthyophthirius multifiliis]